MVLACDDLRTLGRTVRSSALFITNIYFSRTAGNYFSPAAEENPLLNLWSLSVEEQFYLTIPLALWLLWKFRKNAVKPVLCGALALSLFAAVYHMGNLEHNKAFYLLHCRAWELLAGCLLALAPAATEQGRGIRWLRLAGWAGILLPFACYSSSTPFPGYTAIPSRHGGGPSDPLRKPRLVRAHPQASAQHGHRQNLLLPVPVALARHRVLDLLLLQ